MYQLRGCACYIWNHTHTLKYEQQFSTLTLPAGQFRAQWFPCPALCSAPIPGLVLKLERHAVWEQEAERERKEKYVLEVGERHWETWLGREREKGDCKSKTNSKALTGRRRRPAVVGLQGGPERAFFNADTCKPLHQDLQCRKQKLGPRRGREPPRPEGVLPGTVVISGQSCHLYSRKGERGHTETNAPICIKELWELGTGNKAT